MKRQFLCVEIPHRRPFQESVRRPPPSPVETEIWPSPPAKKRKSGPLNSPTVSDFENELVTTDDLHDPSAGLPGSPTVSDFMDNGNSMTDATLAPSEDDENRWRPKRTMSTPMASGSNVTLEVIEMSMVRDVFLDEILEDDELEIPGETSDSSVGQNDVPVRVLDDFTIFDASSNKLVPIAQLGQLQYSSQKFSASGLVKAWIDDDEDNLEDEDDSDDDDDDNYTERIKLSKILEFDVHSISESTGDPDSKIYIRTKFAWYILRMPSQQYKPFFVPFWIMHRVLHLLLNTVIRNPSTSYEEFLTYLDDVEEENFAKEDALACLEMLGKVLTESDIQSDDVKAYVAALFPDMCDDYGLSVKKVRLSTDYLELDPDAYDEPKKGSAKRPRPSKKVLSNKEYEVLKHRTSTYVTPVVSQIMKHLFSVPLDLAEVPVINDDPDVGRAIDNTYAHHSDPLSMKWGHPATDDGYYSSLIMDGVEYKVGDNVMVVPGDDEDAKRARTSETDASTSPNTYANLLWFCKICYFFDETKVGGKKVKMFHGQWFMHGSKTILQETAHSKSLFLLKTCENNPVASIFRKCNITMMGTEDAELPDDGQPDSNDFHCSLAYDEQDACFTDIPTDEEMEKLLSRDDCLACAYKRLEKEHDEFLISSDEFSRHGHRHHLNDFIYIRSSGGTAGLLEIAQIVSIGMKNKSLLVTVRTLLRPKERRTSGPQLPLDERRLYLSDRTRVLDDPYLIDGVCHVRFLTDVDEIEEWVAHNDHFYVNQEVDANGEVYDMEEDDLDMCDKCEKELKKERKQQKKLLLRNGPIRCLELFSGAGGLGTGLDLSGFVETKYAVEFSPSAAATYAKNHPHATVYCQDSNKLLKQAYEASKGEKTAALLSGIDRKPLPLMPKRGDVDMISGGPPCQSFSRANHNPKPDDIRSTLPGNMLGYVELYNPQYFLLENVAGLLSYRLMSTRSTTKRSLVGGIEAGMVKFIMRTLIALGYQVRIKVLQAGQYGAPQSRRRTIFWGAKRGVTIPEYPVPLYAFDKGMNRSSLPTTILSPVSRGQDPETKHQCAPLCPITIQDAIGDLPPFEWINPHKLVPATSKDKKTARYRIADGIPAFDAVSTSARSLPGFFDGAEYACGPENRYQKWLRRGMEKDKDVQGHYTKLFSAHVVEATTTVPIRPLANHTDIPLILQAQKAKPNKKSARISYYGRLGGDMQFKCAMTSAAPNSKESWLLHPSQKRIMSIRELARSQGFPDHYVFLSEDSKKLAENQIRQIGNAVPVPLALHLGKALGAALMKDWEKDWERREREGSVVV